MAAIAVTPVGVRDGDPDALAGLCDRRGPAVLAYCEVVAGRGAPATAAAAEAFGSFRAGVVAAPDLANLNPEALLISATRHAAARHSALDTPEPHSRALRLLAARADRSITLTDHDWLEQHVATCWTCRAPIARFEAADRAYRDPPNAPLPADAAEAMIAALLAAAPLAGAEVEPPALEPASANGSGPHRFAPPDGEVPLEDPQAQFDPASVEGYVDQPTSAWQVGVDDVDVHVDEPTSEEDAARRARRSARRAAGLGVLGRKGKRAAGKRGAEGKPRTASKPGVEAKPRVEDNPGADREPGLTRRPRDARGGRAASRGRAAPQESAADDRFAPDARTDDRFAPDARTDDRFAPGARVDDRFAPDARANDRFAPDARADEDFAADYGAAADYGEGGAAEPAGPTRRSRAQRASRTPGTPPTTRSARTQRPPTASAGRGTSLPRPRRELSTASGRRGPRSSSLRPGVVLPILLVVLAIFVALVIAGVFGGGEAESKPQSFAPDASTPGEQADTPVVVVPGAGRANAAAVEKAKARARAAARREKEAASSGAGAATGDDAATAAGSPTATPTPKTTPPPPPPPAATKAGDGDGDKAPKIDAGKGASGAEQIPTDKDTSTVPELAPPADPAVPPPGQ